MKPPIRLTQTLYSDTNLNKHKEWYNKANFTRRVQISSLGVQSPNLGGPNSQPRGRKFQPRGSKVPTSRVQGPNLGGPKSKSRGSSPNRMLYSLQQILLILSMQNLLVSTQILIILFKQNFLHPFSKMFCCALFIIPKLGNMWLLISRPTEKQNAWGAANYTNTRPWKVYRLTHSLTHWLTNSLTN